MAWNPGQKLFGDRYFIESKLGEGGIGITYLAQNRSGELRVIKTLREQILNHPDWIPHQDKLRQDFRDEALRLALCRHPHIVQVENVFDEENLPCMAMEYIAGEDLKKRITNKGALPEAEALEYIRQIGEALTVVHAKGLLHRDLKPNNIMMRAGKQEAVLIDFGLARQFISGVALQHTESLTPGYAPPEQYLADAERGEYIDVYALAATLYALVTGQLPMPAPARLQNFTLKAPKDFNSSISDRVNEAIMWGMALNYKFRPQSVQEWLKLFGVEVVKRIQPTQPNFKPQTPVITFSQTWKCVQIITNYASSVASVAFSPDGKILASGGVYKGVKLWSVANGQEIDSFEFFANQSLSFSANGKILAGASFHGFSAWDIISRKEIYTIEFGTFGDELNSAAFSFDGQILATASSRDCGSKIQLWDVATGKEIRTITIGDDYYPLTFSPDGRILASVFWGKDGVIQLWDVATGREICTISSRSKDVQALAFSQDSKILAISDNYGGFFYSPKGSIKLWDVATGKKICSIKADSKPITSLTFSPDGEKLASGDENGDIKLWRLNHNRWQQVKLQNICTLTSESDSWVESIKFSPDGETLVSNVSSDNHGITLWSLDGLCQYSEICKLSGHVQGINCLTISPDGQIIATSSDSGLKLWDVRSGAFIRRFGHEYKTIVFSFDGKILISATREETIHWEVATGRKIRTVDTRPHDLLLNKLPGLGAFINAITFSQDGEILAVAGKNSDIDEYNIRLANAATGQNICTIIDSEYTNCIALSLDKKILVSISYDVSFVGSSFGKIKLWEVKTGKPVRTINTYPEAHSTITLSPNGKILASSNHKCIKLWELPYGNQLYTINSSIVSYSDLLSFSPDGQILASSCSDNTIKLWDVASGNEIATLTGHSSQISSIIFSRDGQILVSSDNDGSIKIWRRS
ncbi:serine/threonine-protein kinase [Calothrix sp. PCC 6303]|uniref:serine/threonine-protein kinase n=1 Tax=Calothrix sp. PCC 6303 TaxID=1170562 RepID=UPI0002A04F77|nr:serine/threonine-protein kinase [Calothrix sp. PCC 6303]AFZ02365.1 serine/threonine protein kinase with WD40 repeats [Calothrix sp. PCC 6303]